MVFSIWYPVFNIWYLVIGKNQGTHGLKREWVKSGIGEESATVRSDQGTRGRRRRRRKRQKVLKSNV